MMLEADRRPIQVTGSWVTTARLDDEWFTPTHQIDYLIDCVRDHRPRPDLFTFRQRLPQVEPIFEPYWYWERDSIAAIPITTMEHWQKSLNKTTRQMLKKAKAAGIVVRPTEFDDAFIAGMHAIFNECPIRQGKPFLHYGKPIDQLREEFARFLFREDILGAYLGDELIGFIYVADNVVSRQLGQIISKIAHRDKGTNTLLIAAAVEYCIEHKVQWLTYAEWSDGTLGDFKRHNGFHQIGLPRYYVPLTWKGSLVLTLRLHHGWKHAIPASWMTLAKRLRAKWHQRQLVTSHSTSPR